MLKIIDNSQYEKYWKCPKAWVANYMQGYFDGVTTGEGPLVLGSLFHAALEAYLTTGIVEIPQSEIQALEATKDTVELASLLISSYVRTYPPEELSLVSCEEALKFSLDPYTWDWKGVSKVDFVTNFEEDTLLSLGLDESRMLPKGIWGVEHKTRQAGNTAGWLKHWEVRMQADFEILALQENYENVQGIIVNTVEYVKPYEPVKTCKKCKTKSKVKLWSPLEVHVYGCPFCKEPQEYKPKKPSPPKVPVCYRFPVVRSQQALEESKAQIAHTAFKMQVAFADKGFVVPNRRSCVEAPQYRVCNYFNLCYGYNSQDLVKLEDPYHYIGLTNNE